MKKGKQLKQLLEQFELQHGTAVPLPAWMKESVVEMKDLFAFVNDAKEFIKKHHEPPTLRFYYLSLFVKPGHTRPFGRFTALTLDDALEAATRSVANRSGDAKNGPRTVFRVDIVELCPDLDKQ